MLCNHFDMLLAHSLQCAYKIKKKKKKKESSIDLCFQRKEGGVQARKSLDFIPEVNWEDLKI